MKVTVNDYQAVTKLKSYAALAKKSINQAVKEEALLTAKRLVQLTPPKTAAQGRKRVSIDIGKIYLQPKWFTEVFNFTNQKFGERIKRLIRAKDSSSLTTIFNRSAKLSQIHIEEFKESIIKRFRKDGRVAKNAVPHSLPLNDEAGKKAYEQKKLKLVGFVKSGWANCVKQLGGSIPGWLNHSGTGRAIVQPEKIILVNSVRYASDLESKKGIVAQAIQGRKRDLEAKVKRLLSQARR